MNFIVAKCEQCGASLDIKENAEKAFCPQCGQAVILQNIANSVTNNTYIINNQSQINQKEHNVIKEKNKAAPLTFSILFLVTALIFLILSFTSSHQIAVEANRNCNYVFGELVCFNTDGITFGQHLEALFSNPLSVFFFVSCIVLVVLGVLLMVLAIVRFVKPASTKETNSNIEVENIVEIN